MSMAGKATVYFNSACPVCRSGVEWQQDRMPSCEIEWIDVHRTPDAVDEISAGLEDVRERLHVRDAEGRILIGADAAVFVMSRTSGQRWLARFISLLRLHRPARRLYNAFARYLYRWNRNKGRW
jgi:predicted DCC family thiol-disulfide oxidoreductase YuxK